MHMEPVQQPSSQIQMELSQEVGLHEILNRHLWTPHLPCFSSFSSLCDFFWFWGSFGKNIDIYQMFPFFLHFWFVVDELHFDRILLASKRSFINL